jgi:hypothetical protein
MTDITLSHVLRAIDINKGAVVREVDNLKAVLVNGHKTVTKVNGKLYVDYNNYLVFLCNEKKVGGLLQCGTVDIHAYMFHQYRDQRIVSRLIGDGFLKKLWPNMRYVTCVNLDEYDRIKHLVEIAGFQLSN